MAIKELSDKELLSVAKNYKESAYIFRKRRHDDWNENYRLYRSNVLLNRLTNRQSVNLPLMKYGLLTLMKDVDELPILYFENLDNDEQTELLYNEYFDDCAKKNKMEIKDIVEKKQAFLYGRAFKKQNIVDGRHAFEIVDVMDMLVSRDVDPTNLHSARAIIQTGIWKTLTQLELTDAYNITAINQLKTYFATEEGLIQASKSFEDVSDRSERMENLGLEDAWQPIMGETYVELNEAYIKTYDAKLEKEVYHVITFANVPESSNPLVINPLLRKRLSTHLNDKDGYFDDHTLFSSWAFDPENTDFWSDGPADIIRPACQTLNIWFSQEVENRTLQNFGMNYYDASNPDFMPQTWTPEAGGWYGLPGKPSDVMETVKIEGLGGNLEAMNFVMNIAEKALAVSSTNQGELTETQVTLGEVKLALVEAKKRVRHVAKFYTEAWMDFGNTYIALIKSNAHLLDDITVYKKGLNGKRMYKKTIKTGEVIEGKNHRVDVKLLEDKQSEDVNSLQKLDYVQKRMPGNTVLDEIIEKKSLEFAGLKPNDIKAVLEFKKQQLAKPPEVTMGAGTQPAALEGAVAPQPGMMQGGQI